MSGIEQPDDVSEFLKKMGMSGDHPEANQWDKIIQPNSSYLIVGDAGTGKSALAYFLLENYSQKYELTPAVVGLSAEKRELLPENFLTVDEPSLCTELEKAMVFIDEADLQLPIENTKARKYVTNFLSLPRHRHQIFLLAFHFPRLVIGRYLPFFSAFLLKRPPYLREFASKSKGDALAGIMDRAEEKFLELPQEDVVKNTYVVAPRIRWQGMLSNPLCSFWSQGLSEVWAGAEIKTSQKAKTKQIGMFPSETALAEIHGVRKGRKGWKVGKDDDIVKGERGEYFVVTETMERRRIEVKRSKFEHYLYITYLDPITQIYWVEG